MPEEPNSFLSLGGQRVPTGISLRAPLASILLQFAVVFAWMSLSPWISIAIPRSIEVAPFKPNEYSRRIFYFRQELPEVTDSTGAESGKSGTSGGGEHFHLKQVIRIARGRRLTPAVADAPSLNLPRVDAPANLLAVSPAIPIGPPPSVLGMTRSMPVSSLAATAAVPPPPPVVAQEFAKYKGLLAPVAVPPPPAVSSVVAQSRLQPPVAQPVQPPPTGVTGSARGRALAAIASQNAVPPPPLVSNVVGTALVGNAMSPPPAVQPPPSGVTGSARGRALAAIASQNAVPPSPPVSNVVGTALVGNAMSPPPAVQPPPSGVTGLSRGALATIVSGQSAVPPAPVSTAIGQHALPGTARLGKAPPPSLPVTLGAAGAQTGSAVSDKDPGALMISPHPGDQVGIGAGENGILAMSPSGGNGGGAGMGNGSSAGLGRGIGAGTSGSDSGSGMTGDGLGSGLNARGGTSLAHGPGGAGAGPPQTTATAAGVLVTNGGYYIPSFSTGSGVTAPKKGSPWSPSRPPAVVVVATPSSTTVLDPASPSRGRRIYTMYVDTHIGSVVMQFVDTSPPGASFARDLTAPAPISADFPADLRPSATTVNGILDRAGKLRNLRLVKTSTPGLITKLFEVLQHWLFRPALRGEQTIEIAVTLAIGTEIH